MSFIFNIKNTQFFRIIFLFFLICFFSLLYGNTTVEGFTEVDIQKAIDSESEKGGGVVFLPQGLYLLRNAIYLKDNVKLKGQGKKTFLKKSNGYFTRVVANIAKDSNKIFVDDISSFKINDAISIFSSSLKRDRVIETKVKEIKDNCIIVSDSLSEEVFFDSNLFISSSFPCIYCIGQSNVFISDLLIDGNNQENFVIDSWWDSGIGIRSSSNINIDNVCVMNSPGDGVSLNGAHHVVITNSLISNSARLGIHIGSGSRYTYLGNSIIENSGLSFKKEIAAKHRLDGLVLCHGAVFGIYENNILCTRQKFS